MAKFISRLAPGRIIALGFALVILLGSGLLMLPCSIQDGVTVRYIDALYTSTSAVCVTGLIAIDAGDTFTPLGQTFLAMLIQVGGLGVTSVGAGIILAMRRRVNLKGRSLIREAMNLDSGRGLVRFVRDIFITTLIFELAGAALSFLVFVQDYPPLDALGISLFHSVAAFNNSGFDILGNFQNLIPYRDNVLLNLVTCGLIIFGGIGFLVIREMWTKRLRWRKFSMHTKVVLSVSAVLIVTGGVLIKLTEDVTWMGAFFHSVSARTAGFSTYNLGQFSQSGLLVLTVLMFIGASPGSTGGGIKTSTFFVLLHGIKAAATNRSERAFHYSIPRDAFRKAAVITLLAAGVVLVGTYLMVTMDPETTLMQALFEVTSAFGTVGLSTGITPGLSDGSKLLSILIMYIGRLGPLTVASLWYFNQGASGPTTPRATSPSAKLGGASMFNRSKKDKPIYGIVGLGRFGTALALELAESGAELLVLDKNEEKVREMREITENAVVIHSLDKKSLAETGIQNCDVAVVCIGEQIDTSILTTLHLVALGIPTVIAKATSAEHGEILAKLGGRRGLPGAGHGRSPGPPAGDRQGAGFRPAQ